MRMLAYSAFETSRQAETPAGDVYLPLSRATDRLRSRGRSMNPDVSSRDLASIPDGTEQFDISTPQVKSPRR